MWFQAVKFVIAGTGSGNYLVLGQVFFFFYLVGKYPYTTGINVTFCVR